METSESSVSNELPFDLITDILSRLHVKSLLRFKSVSKTFYALIKSPNFIKKHQKMSKLNPILPFSALLTYALDKNGKAVFRVNLIHTLDKPIDLEMPFSYEGFVRILGVSDGLVCITFRQEKSNIIICNPVTGDFRKIPPCKKPFWHNELNFFGFGSLANNYELIKIGYDSIGIKANSYSLRVNTWRDIHMKIGHKLEFLIDRISFAKFASCQKVVPVLQNGVFYWKGKFCIMSFDISNELLDELRAPPDDPLIKWKLIKLKEEIAVVVDHKLWFNLWVLDEKSKTWTKKYSTGGVVTPMFQFNFDSYQTVLGGSRSGELLMKDRYGETLKLSLYNMDNGDVYFFPYVFSGSREPYLFTESLVSVGMGDDLVEAVSDLSMT